MDQAPKGVTVEEAQAPEPDKEEYNHPHGMPFPYLRQLSTKFLAMKKARTGQDCTFTAA
jgi:hypothetical protein